MTTFQVIYEPVPISISTPLWKSVVGDLQSVFTELVLLSDALCVFLELPVGSSIPRVEITKRFVTYVKDRGLLDRASIKKDDAITALFHLSPEDTLNILNLQKYIAPHTKAITKRVTNEELFRSWWLENGSSTNITVDVNELPSWRLEKLYKLLSTVPLTECVIFNAKPPEDEECDYCEGDCECEKDEEDEEDEKPVASCGCSKLYHAVCSKHV